MSNISVNNLDSINPINKTYDVYDTALQEDKASGDMFSSIFDASMNMIDETNAYQQEAKQLQLDFASGKNDNILEVTLAQEKAMSALNFTVQVTNKLMEAYKEIMQIQL